MSQIEHDTLRALVRERYAGIVNAGGSCCGGKSCCSSERTDAEELSQRVGYTEEELQAAPAGANLGLGCGNPQVIAKLKPGETVVDLGSGAGFDCFLAARQVGETGKVIGVDMTPDMITKARANARKSGFANVEFRLGEIEHLPVADGTADVIISNCVINLSPDKRQVINDAFRVLRAGGRLAISDVVAIQPLPESVKRNLDAFCGCVAGAATVADLEKMLTDAGFEAVEIKLNRESREFIKDWFPDSGVEDFVSSASIEAIKP